MKILLFRARLVFYKSYKNLLLFWKFYLLFSKYWKWFNFLIILWVMPMDSRNILELFNALLDDNTTNTEEENKYITRRRLETFFYIVFIGFTVVVIYYTFCSGGSEGFDFSSFSRVIPEEPIKYSVNDEGELFVSLLDEVYNTDIKTQKT